MDPCLYFKKVGKMYTFKLPNCEESQDDGELGRYFEGDILLTPEEQRQDHPDYKTRFWENGELIYEFEPFVSEWEKELIHRGMREITQMTKNCIQFIPRQIEVNYVRITNTGKGCYSRVGKEGQGSQPLNLDPNCTKKHGTIMLEFIHALAFYHEQSRRDRDEYVKILGQNIEADKEHNFVKYEKSVDFNSPYDYESVMHYSKRAFGKIVNGQRLITIEPFTPLPPGVEIGQRVQMSDSDIQQLMAMYNYQ